MELRAGHVHRDQYGRRPAPEASHRPVRNKKKSHSVTSHASNPERPNIPERVGPLEPPRLRALEARVAAIPASSASPRSGSSRVHPCPVGEAVEASSFELVPSMATQATHISDRDESMEVTPIRRPDSTPDTPFDPTQVMSPNLGAGMASGSTQGPGEQEVDQVTHVLSCSPGQKSKGKMGPLREHSRNVPRHGR